MTLKRLPIERLRPGMYVHELGGSWMDHSFWRTRFEIAGPEDLQKMREAGLREVVIDTEKGLDVDEGAPAQPAAAAPSPVAAPAPVAPTAPRVSVREEITRAAAITRAGEKAVRSMFATARMGRAIRADSMQPLVSEIHDSVSRNPHALVGLARLKTKDDYTYMHSVAVCGLMTLLARKMNLPEDIVHRMGMGGLLHDIGKMTIPDAILNKPGKLTDEEFAIIRTHPKAGWQLLQENEVHDEIVLDVCLHHQEKLDGSGYPDKLAGDKLSRYARLAAVCDVYDAVTSVRPYNNGWNPGEALRRMFSWKGHFDEAVLRAFISCLGIYPVGSLVRMQSQRIGVIVDQGEKPLEPMVKVFYSAKSNSYITPQLLDLSRTQDRIAGVEDPEKWHFKDLATIWSNYRN